MILFGKKKSELWIKKIVLSHIASFLQCAIQKLVTFFGLVFHSNNVAYSSTSSTSSPFPIFLFLILILFSFQLLAYFSALCSYSPLFKPFAIFSVSLVCVRVVETSGINEIKLDYVIWSIDLHFVTQALVANFECNSRDVSFFEKQHSSNVDLNRLAYHCNHS